MSNKQVGPPPARLRVNVGCGASPTPGWYNIDNSLTVALARLPFARLVGSRSGFVAKVVANNVRYGRAVRLPLPAGSVEVLYSSHMIEHLDRNETLAFLAEARRVLAPGSRIRLAVPDIRRAVDDYLEEGDADRFVDGLLMAVPRPSSAGERLSRLLVGFRGHRWMYDEGSLVRLLERAGFRDVAAWPAGQTGIANPGPLNLREREDESIYVEATV